jgi:hypothetical protein
MRRSIDYQQAEESNFDHAHITILCISQGSCTDQQPCAGLESEPTERQTEGDQRHAGDVLGLGEAAQRVPASRRAAFGSSQSTWTNRVVTRLHAHIAKRELRCMIA